MDMTLTGEPFAVEVQRARELLKNRLAEIEPDPEGRANLPRRAYAH